MKDMNIEYICNPESLRTEIFQGEDTIRSGKSPHDKVTVFAHNRSHISTGSTSCIKKGYHYIFRPVQGFTIHHGSHSSELGHRYLAINYEIQIDSSDVIEFDPFT